MTVELWNLSIKTDTQITIKKNIPELIGLIHLCEHLQPVGVNISISGFYEKLTQRSQRTTEF